MIGQTNAIWKVNGKYEQLVNYTMLYDNGDECTDITGGYTFITNSTNAANNNTAEKKQNCLYQFSGGQSGSTSSWRGSYFSNNLIDLSSYEKAFIVCDCTVNNTSYGFGLSVYTQSKKENNDSYIVNWGIVSSGGTTESKIARIGNIEAASRALPVYVAPTCRHAQYSLYNLALLKQDDWQTLAEKARITASSIDDILTSSIKLLSNKKAVEFMIYNCTGDFMASAVLSQTFLTALNNSPYKTLIWSNEHWAKFLNMVA